MAYSLTIPPVFVRACPCSSVLVRVRPPHALIEAAKKPTSQEPAKMPELLIYEFDMSASFGIE
jgi:hypothetical protein